MPFPKNISGFTPYSHIAARISDAASIILAGHLAYWLRFGHVFNLVERYQWMMLSAMLLGMIIFSRLNLYRSWRGSVRVALVVKLVHAFAILSAIIFAYLYFTKTGARFTRTWLILWLVLAFMMSVGSRVIAYPLLNRFRLKGNNRKQVYLIGDTDSCLLAYQHLRQMPAAGFDIAGVRLMDGHRCDDMPPIECKAFDPEVDDKLCPDEIWVCMPLSRGKEVETVLNCFQHSTSNIRYMPDTQGLRLLNHDISTVAGLYLIDMSCSPLSGSARFVKMLEDRMLASLLLLLASPLMLSIALSIKLTSRGPVLYRQERMSWNGVPFDMLKFRTMPVDSEAEGTEWGGAGDMRTTRVGRWLRRSSLDELPQLINVLKGDMSIVGPRPERSMFVHRFKHEIPGYMQKHMMHAGITGWAQIHGWRGDTDLEKRIEFDLWYIENWSLMLDLKIIFLTLWRGFFHPNAR